MICDQSGRELIAAWRLGRSRDRDLVEFGIRLLMETPTPSDALVSLAGLGAAELPSAYGLFEQVLADFAVEVPTESAARMTFVEKHARDIVSHKIDPCRGCALIVRDGCIDSEFPELAGFIELGEECEMCPGQPDAELIGRIIEEARTLVGER